MQPNTSAKERFARSCNEAAWFPRNLVLHDSYEHNLKAYVKRLDEHEPTLFCNGGKPSLDLWEYDDQSGRFISTCVRSETAVREQFDGDVSDISGGRDPKCRFVFAYAPNSRERLYVDRNMMTYVLTYLQAQPAFLDFLFPFGSKVYENFHFSGFRHEERLEPQLKGLEIPELGRSGRDIRMCYNLKSVEQSKSQQQWPWSIRQTAVYHSFDVDTGIISWIIVKGSDLLKRRIQIASGPSGHRDLNDFDTKFRAFGSSLATHLMIASWCAEDWRWYINFLEESLQKKTRRTIAGMKFETPVSPVLEKPLHASTWGSSTTKIDKSSFFSRSHSQSFSKMFTPTSPQKESLETPPPPPPGPPQPFYMQNDSQINPETLSLSDLQRVQWIEEKANEALLVLDSNVNVLTELNRNYEAIMASEHWDHEVNSECRGEIGRFQNRITGIVNDLQMEVTRTKTLIRLIADRKALLYGILQYRSTEASKLLALEAQQSSKRVEGMTEDMHNIAQRTQQETVSMRIITLVTLFFLPGTFISTIMSTDILHYSTNSEGKSQKVVQIGAVEIYLALTLPLMLVSFGAWYGAYWWFNRKEELERQKKDEELKV